MIDIEIIKDLLLSNNQTNFELAYELLKSQDMNFLDFMRDNLASFDRIKHLRLNIFYYTKKREFYKEIYKKQVLLSLTKAEKKIFRSL